LMTVYLKLQNQYKQHQSSVQKKDNPKYWNWKWQS
jgi:hypothetical protein